MTILVFTELNFETRAWTGL